MPLYLFGIERPCMDRKKRQSHASSLRKFSIAMGTVIISPFRDSPLLMLVLFFSRWERVRWGLGKGIFLFHITIYRYSYAECFINSVGTM